jgi:SAM-dependent methyltransferase
MTRPTDAIAAQYERRKQDPRVRRHAENTVFDRYIREERERHYARIIRERYTDIGALRVLEIGAGVGSNLPFFLQLGVPPTQLHANELLPDRLAALQQRFPGIHIHPGDANDMDGALDGTFDIVFQSTVFTSILDGPFKRKLAQRMWRLLKPGGIVLWYDFTFDNPGNPDVRGIPRSEVKTLFPEATDPTFHRVTLAPPIGRRVGRLYPLVNSLAFLRTHVVAVIAK